MPWFPTPPPPPSPSTRFNKLSRPIRESRERQMKVDKQRRFMSMHPTGQPKAFIQLTFIYKVQTISQINKLINDFELRSKIVRTQLRNFLFEDVNKDSLGAALVYLLHTLIHIYNIIIRFSFWFRRKLIKRTL